MTFTRIVIETTGLADPAPVAQTFFIDDDIAASYRLDAIVTVVDAKHANGQLESFHEAQEQVGFADRILLSKADLVSAAEIARPARAPGPDEPAVRRSGRCISATLRSRTSSTSAASRSRASSRSNPASSKRTITSTTTTSLPSSSPVRFRSDQDRLEAAFRHIIAAHAEDLMRYKGIVAFAGLDHSVVFQGVHMMMSSDVGRAVGGERRPSVETRLHRSGDCLRMTSSTAWPRAGPMPLDARWFLRSWPPSRSPETSTGRTAAASTRGVVS